MAHRDDEFVEVAELTIASLVCEDGNYKTVYSKPIPFTDFPAEGITLWFANDVIYLPSEH